jgi:hypothetical protein
LYLSMSAGETDGVILLIESSKSFIVIGSDSESEDVSLH